MPIPVSVTHASRAGLQAQSNDELHTQGPFARLAQAAQTSSEFAVSLKEATVEVQPAAAAVDDPPGAALLTHGLNFWYTDNGENSLAGIFAISTDA